MNRNVLSTIDRASSVDSAPRAALTDEELTDSIRNGDSAAFDELYRRYARSARSYARSLLRSEQDAEDAAADAFANVLAALRRQGGPRQLFRPYLIACVRNSCARRQRQRSAFVSLQDHEPAAIETKPAEDPSEREVAAKAFACLSNRWRAALWMAEVQHLDVPAIAHCMELSVPATSALLHRARQAFAESYLSQHLHKASAPACVRLAPKIARYVRGTAGAMSCRQIEAHIVSCLDCALAVKELTDLNSSLRSVSPPWCGAVGAGGTCVVVAASETSAGLVAGLATSWLAKAAVVVAFAAVPLITHEASAPTIASTTSVPTVALTQRNEYSPGLHQSAANPPATPTSLVAAGNGVAVKAVAPPAPETRIEVPPVVSSLPLIVTPPPVSIPVTTVPAVGGVIEAANGTLPAIVPSASAVVSLPGVTAEISTQPSVAVVVSVTAPTLPISVPAISLPAISVPAINLSCVISFARPPTCS